MSRLPKLLMYKGFWVFTRRHFCEKLRFRGYLSLPFSGYRGNSGDHLLDYIETLKIGKTTSSRVHRDHEDGRYSFSWITMRPWSGADSFSWITPRLWSGTTYPGLPRDPEVGQTASPGLLPRPWRWEGTSPGLHRDSEVGQTASPGLPRDPEVYRRLLDYFETLKMGQTSSPVTLLSYKKLR